MNDDAASPHRTADLIDKYLDDDLTPEELATLQDCLAKNRQVAMGFVEAALMHDQLRAKVLARTAVGHGSMASDPASDLTDIPTTSPQVPEATWSITRGLVLLAALAAAVLLVFGFWLGNDNRVMAGHTELRKMLAASALEIDRAYTINVEASVVGGAKQRRKPSESERPPKPSLDGAGLWVRGQREFVLKRTTAEGTEFVTGCDGQSSWAVKAHGPVRVSRDLTRFNHDVPGHEFSLPLVNLFEALTHLQQAFELSVLPAEYADVSVESNSSSSVDGSSRLLVATKKRGYPGPRRVEITYLPENGQIQQIRFVDMPYGADRLTVRLSLIETVPLSDDFFQHAAHHAPDRIVVQE